MQRRTAEYYTMELGWISLFLQAKGKTWFHRIESVTWRRIILNGFQNNKCQTITTSCRTTCFLFIFIFHLKWIFLAHHRSTASISPAFTQFTSTKSKTRLNVMRKSAKPFDGNWEASSRLKVYFSFALAHGEINYHRFFWKSSLLFMENDLIVHRTEIIISCKLNLFSSIYPFALDLLQNYSLWWVWILFSFFKHLFMGFSELPLASSVLFLSS